MPSIDSERRRQKRIRARLPVRFDYNNNEASALTKNISLLGTCVDLDREVLPGTRIALSLDIPQYTNDSSLTGEVRGEGAVVRCFPVKNEDKQASEPLYELAIFFSDFTPPGEEKLDKYLDYAVEKEEQEIRQWATEYRAHIEERKKKAALKKMEAAKKRAARLAKRQKKERERLKRIAQRAREKAKKREKMKLPVASYRVS